MTPDRIEKIINLKAPIDRVWHAITDHVEFGTWFNVALDGPFKPGEVSRGQITYPGYEGLKWEAAVQAMEPERLFSFTWCPTANDPDVDYSGEPLTLVEFRFEAAADGTRLVVSESGFDALPDGPARDEAFKGNSQGWDIQAKNIVAHIDG
ncbi:MAG: SRPBCC family protein [Gammaproteobacteria bacterium]|nr:SRPBCC family protein [Gammaproteobacteria bacterium]